MMGCLDEGILSVFTKRSGNKELSPDELGWEIKDPLSILKWAFPEFLRIIKDKIILDFGCGLGYQTVSLVEPGAAKVVGLETNPKSLERAKKLIADRNLDNKVECRSVLNTDNQVEFDVIISQNSFEHFRDPVGILQLMKGALRPKGAVLITFGPPWYAPYGSHMGYFTHLPWVNILFSERTVMNVRKRFRSDGATKYEEVEGGLNRMSVDKFERIISKCGFDVTYRRYDCVKKFEFLSIHSLFA